MLFSRCVIPPPDEDRKAPMFHGERLILRQARLSDAPQWIDMRARNRDFLQPWEPLWPVDSLTELYFRHRLERQARERKAGTAQSFLIFLKDGEQLAGAINLNNICRGSAQFASLGYWLDESLQGRGYMTEAGRLLINHAFGEFGLHRLNAGSLPENTRSRALLLRLGFREEGFAPCYLEINGRWADHVLYGLTAEEKSGAPCSA